MNVLFLLKEEDSINLEVLEVMLSSTATVTVEAVTTVVDFFESCGHCSPQIVVVQWAKDWQWVPGRLRSREMAPFIIVLVNGVVSSDQAADMCRVGAHQLISSAGCEQQLYLSILTGLAQHQLRHPG